MRLLRERGARGIQVGGSPPDGVLSLLDPGDYRLVIVATPPS